MWIVVFSTVTPYSCKQVKALDHSMVESPIMLLAVDLWIFKIRLHDANLLFSVLDEIC